VVITVDLHLTLKESLGHSRELVSQSLQQMTLEVKKLMAVCILSGWAMSTYAILIFLVAFLYSFFWAPGWSRFFQIFYYGGIVFPAFVAIIVLWFL